MSGIGFFELVVLFVIGLLILGPERLPRVATQIGRWVGRARRTANQLRYQLEREIALSDIEKKSKDSKSTKTGTGASEKTADTHQEEPEASESGQAESASDRPPESESPSTEQTIARPRPPEAEGKAEGKAEDANKAD